MLILGIDLSSKTGWSVAKVDGGEFSLLSYGLLKKSSETDFEDGFPKNYLDWANHIFTLIKGKIDETKADIIVIEQTVAGSKNVFGQKLLEWTHKMLAEYLIEKNLKHHYFLTGEWRVLVGCVMTKEEKKRNLAVRKQKKAGIKVAKGDDGKRIGKIGKKHVNVRRANELCGLNLILAQEDQADAILLSRAYYEKFKDIQK